MRVTLHPLPNFAQEFLENVLELHQPISDVGIVLEICKIFATGGLVTEYTQSFFQPPGGLGARHFPQTLLTSCISAVVSEVYYNLVFIYLFISADNVCYLKLAVVH